MNLERLYFLREEFDLTQEDIGKIVGTKKYSIYNWESGKEIIPLSKLNAYANYFKVPMDYIVKIDDNKHSENNDYELDKMIIGQNIKYIREKNNLTQRDLAKLLNTTQSVIWAYETGRTLILTAFAYDLCKKFNLSMDWLCGRKK